MARAPEKFSSGWFSSGWMDSCLPADHLMRRLVDLGMLAGSEERTDDRAVMQGRILPSDVERW